MDHRKMCDFSVLPELHRRLRREFHVRECRRMGRIALVLLAAFILCLLLGRFGVLDMKNEGVALLADVFYATVAVIGLIIGTSIWWLVRAIRKIDTELARATHSGAASQ